MSVEDKAGTDLVTAMKDINKELHACEKHQNIDEAEEMIKNLGTVARAFIDDVTNKLDDTDEGIIKLAHFQNYVNSSDDSTSAKASKLFELLSNIMGGED